MSRINVTVYTDCIDKFNNGELLTKGNCELILNHLYDAFMSRFNTAANIEDVVLYTDEDKLLWTILIENAVKTVEKYGRPFSVDEAKSFYGWHFCVIHDAKLAGMESTSSSNLVNKFCQENQQITDSICFHCFAAALMNARGSMKKPYTINFLLLNFQVLPICILPMINRQYERIESFGDVASVIQATNYINLTQAHEINRNCRFGVWSKNAYMYFVVFDRQGKPNNVSFGVSSLFINHENWIPKKYIHYVDFLFTVFDSVQAAAEKGLSINCGARHCLSCLRCYNARDNKPENGYIHVIELLKNI